jgi:nucleotide-binding universal stress UspA family protein
MNTLSKTNLFKKVLVPIVYGCEQTSAINTARAIAGENNMLLVGIVYVPKDESLSGGAVRVQEVRQTLRNLSGETMHRWTEVRATYQPWEEIIRVVEKEKPDLLILEYPCQFDSLQVTPTEVLTHPPCDIAIVNSMISEDLKNVLIPIRGGPYAELALRTGLSMQHLHNIDVTSLHVVPATLAGQQDAAYRGIERVLKYLPEVKKREIATDSPAQIIFDLSRQYDLIVMGASSRPAEEFTSIGPVAERIMQESECGVIVVKTERPLLNNPASEESGQSAISVLVDKWFAENTFHANEFQDLEYLQNLKRERGLTVSLALPALNEQATVGKVIETIQQALMLNAPLLDGLRRGKGEALWKSLYCTQGDIVIWLDTDIVNIHPRFAYGLIGPLLLRPDIQFVKGFYRRPLKVGDKIQEGGGGRVTELTARPLLNLFYPELSGVIQPLSGEYGGRRRALEQLRFFSGYGVEIGLLIDVLEKFGLDAIAQVDLQERIHHNQPLEALSKMSFAIIQAVIRKLESRFGQSILENVNQTMKLIHYEQDGFRLDIEEIAERDRPAMIELSEYRERLRMGLRE